MKKYLAILTGMLFVLGFAANAFAVHAEVPSETQAVVAKGETQITLGGEIRFRGEANDNLTDFNNDASDGASFYDGRVRLNVDAKVAPNVEGFVQIETGTVDADTYTWGTPSSAKEPTGIYSGANGAGGNVKPTTFSLLQGWILYGMDWGAVKVGHMPLYLGNKLFFDHSKFGDDAIVVVATPIKNLEIDALTIKFEDQKTSNSADQDAYVFIAGYKGDTFNVGGDVTYVNINSGSSFGLGQSDLTNIGVRGSVNFGMFTVRADGEFQTGKFDKNGAVTGSSIKAKGYAVLAAFDANLGVAKLTLEAAQGSGTKTSDTDFKTFVTSLGADQHFTFVYDYRTAGARDASPLTGVQYQGIANTTYLKLGATINPLAALQVDAAAFLLRATQAPASGVSKSVGEEIDAKITYKVAKNLNYWIQGGYLIAGDYYKDTLGSDDNAWDVRQGIQLSF